MSQAYLEGTYRKGRPWATYYYLPRRAGDHSVRTEERDGLLIDFARDDRAIGIEITSPQQVNLFQVNQVLAGENQELLGQDDFRPLAKSA